MTTSPSDSGIGTNRGSIPLLLTLIAAGLAGNYFKFPLFLNIDFLFGSIFAMLALQFCGLGRGLLAAAVIAGYSYFLWNHPYAIIVMTAEVGVVGALTGRRKTGMVLADTLYWLVIGMPLVYLFYHVVMLIAEDDAASRLMLQSLLTKWGYSVTAACDGDEAWRMLCEAQHPLLVVLDWMMPGIEGPEIVRRLRLKEDGNPHYIIIMTAANSENAAAMALDAGADDFIVKPFNPDELRARIAVGRRVNCLHQALADKLHKLEAATETISRLARTDELTGLHNRRSFNEVFAMALSAARRHGHPLSLISIDLDHFKAVNDTFGHSVGDLVLKEFADLILEMVRNEDVAVRWGGEEFIILLSHTACKAAAALAERIRSRFEQNPSAAPLPVTASFGVAQLQDGEQEGALIKRADDALYRAKHEGRNRVVTADEG